MADAIIVDYSSKSASNYFEMDVFIIFLYSDHC